MSINRKTKIDVELSSQVIHTFNAQFCLKNIENCNSGQNLLSNTVSKNADKDYNISK